MIFDDDDPFSDKGKIELAKRSIQRIRNIADDLLNKNKHLNSLIYLPPLIENLINEKKQEFKLLKQVSISFSYSSGNAKASSKIDPVQFSRILSNLINNAVEAFPNSIGDIAISLETTNHHVVISLQDNGIGIPKAILEKLGKEEISFGKEKCCHSGSGIGVFGAIKLIKEWGGNLDILSNEGEGTLIKIKLPLF